MQMNGTKLLLTSVFGPYGVTEPFAEGVGMQMELLNNQVTREQGVHSPRVVGAFSYGLYLIAKNLSVPTVLLDFPGWNDFVKELKNGYTHVGISFIIPNILKVQRMTRHIRAHYPDIKIILGGAGVVIPELADLVSYDEVCHGEGIRWMRRYFGEDPDKRIDHPIVTGDIDWYYYGYRVKETASQIFPGVGCKNACDFCHTSHFFNKRYTPFIETGKEMFDICHAEEKEHKTELFTVVDENFLKRRERAVELLHEMEEEGKAYSYCIFASAETIVEVGIDFLVRLGVNFVWLGLESKNGAYEKLKDVDLSEIVRNLRAHGIKVLGSAILFLDHHDKQTMQEDINWAIQHKTDFLQFMGLCVVPGTELYDQYVNACKLIEGYPWNKMTGQSEIWFKHPNFKSTETGQYVRDAFRRNYEVNGPSSLNVISTVINGYITNTEEVERRREEGLAWDPEAFRYRKNGTDHHRDDFMELRLASQKALALSYREVLLAIKAFAPNRAARRKCDELRRLFTRVFGKPTMADRLKSYVFLGYAVMEAAKIAIRDRLGKGEIVRQPPTRRTEYREKPV